MKTAIIILQCLEMILEYCVHLSYSFFLRNTSFQLHVEK